MKRYKYKTHFTVGTIYDKFQNSTIIRSQANLTSEGAIFFTVHTKVTQRTCSPLRATQQPTQKKHHKLQYQKTKTKISSVVSLA